MSARAPSVCRSRRPIVVLAALAAATLLVARARAEEPEQLRTALDQPFEVENLRLDLDVDLKGHAVSGRATLRIKALRELHSLALDGVELQVSKVLVAAEPKAQLP